MQGSWLCGLPVERRLYLLGRLPILALLLLKERFQLARLFKENRETTATESKRTVYYQMLRFNIETAELKKEIVLDIPANAPGGPSVEASRKAIAAFRDQLNEYLTSLLPSKDAITVEESSCSGSDNE